ncbi:MAG: hypothetical protein AAGA67_03635, partial [Cyanobacteria bacterium P01_F01_bin.153]
MAVASKVAFNDRSHHPLDFRGGPETGTGAATSDLPLQRHFKGRSPYFRKAMTPTQSASAKPNSETPQGDEPPILLTWTIITAVGACIFGSLVHAMLGNNSAGEPGNVVVAVLMGGLIVGWLEWQTLRFYRVPVGFVWCGLKAGVLVAVIGAMFYLDRTASGDTFFLLPLWGMILDGSRWFLLRSHFPKTWFWLFFCAFAWVVDIAIFFGVGIATIDLMPEALFIPFNSAVNGAWIGFFR